MMKKALNLQFWLVCLLMLSTLSTGVIMSALVLFVSLPKMEDSRRFLVSRSAVELADRTEEVLSSVEERLTLLSALQKELSAPNLDSLARNAVGRGAVFDAIYIIGRDGKIKSAYVSRDEETSRRSLVNSDMSGNQLYRQALSRPGVTWSDKYLSVFLGMPTIGVAVAKEDTVVMAELRWEYIARMIHLTINDARLRVLVMDRRGEVVVDSKNPRHKNIENFGGDPAFQKLLSGRNQAETLVFKGGQYHAARGKSERLGWSFFAMTPAGLDDEELRSTLLGAMIILTGSLVIGLILAPFWGLRLVQSVDTLIKHARAVIAGDFSIAWPRGRVSELNQLSDDLERMANSLKDQERQQLAIFEVAPVAMFVVELVGKNRIIKVNATLETLFGHTRNDIVGLGDVDFLRKICESQSVSLHALLQLEDNAWQEVTLLRRDKEPLRCVVGARTVVLHERNLRLYVIADVTQRALLEKELKDLNFALEQRVEQRTVALSQSNAELTVALGNLRKTQNELVRAEKLAALGSVVAGVAHELNTPIGNGILAVSTLTERVRGFQGAVLRGLKRSELDDFMVEVEEAVSIVRRNLDRAGHLVASFKQVSVDQTSSQRRAFDLHDLIEDVLITIMPTVKKTPYRLESSIERGIQMDTYAGPLEQVIVNLINNAILHGFEGRDHGLIKIAASPFGHCEVALTVSDDGVGIADEVRDRIFDPFVTTKLGQGGSGLGLHIVHNIVTHVLGGDISVRTERGQGATFVLLLPMDAPRLAGRENVEASLAS